MQKHLHTCFWILLLCLALLGTSCDEESPFDDHLYVVRKGNFYGYIDPEGNKVIGASFAYAMEYSVSSGLGAVNVGGTPDGKHMPTNGKWGFINRLGEFVINPKYHSPVSEATPYDIEELSMAMHEGYIFSEGLAAVLKTPKEWVYINERDSVVIDGLRIQSARRFSEGLAAVYIDGKWGYIDKEGRMVIEPQFLFPENFDEGHALVMDTDFHRYVIDKEGRRIFSQYRVKADFHEGVAPIRAGFRGRSLSYREELEQDKNFPMGLMDSSGHIIVQPEFDRLGKFGEGLCPALVGSEYLASNNLSVDEHTGGKWGFINREGKVVINFIYDEAKGFTNGAAPVRRGDYWGYIDAEGRFIFKPSFIRVTSFQGDVARVQLGPSYGTYAGRMAYVNRLEKGIIWIEE